MSTATVTRPSVWSLAVKVMGVVTVLVLGGSYITAGQLVQDHKLEELHGSFAVGLHVVTGVFALCLVILAVTSRAHVWAAVLGVLVFAFTFVQAQLGSDDTLYLHIPGALIITVGTVLLAAWSFTARARTTI